MAFFKGRLPTILLLAVFSAVLWHLLEAFTYRYLISAIPALFAVQVTLSDVLEDILVSKVGYRTRWFTLLIAPGTILHELCHLFAALITGCTVTKVSLFKPNPRTGVVGFVSYTQRRDKWIVFREFIVGFAPFFGCGLMLFLFNLLNGGTLLDLVNPDPIGNSGDALALSSSIISLMVDSASRLDFTQPVVFLFIYLQFCFAVGAAPSSVDFRGSFGSLSKNLFSAVFFLAFLAALVFTSQGYFPVEQVQGQLASYVAIALKFTVIVLLLSTSLLLIAIPLAFVAIKLSEIKGIAKTIPVTSSLLAYQLLLETRGIRLAALAAAAVLLIAYLIFKPRKTRLAKQT
ncbi:MAG: hypothetical protein GF416_06190 [Candidatus Altiarchaeales archaeon]|nr:hypothetical protein [Candidatus Altiarchaeales archaeon]MBD3416705.1 hypothetical protein [Candidatus Altiarchaeales archaeon]